MKRKTKLTAFLLPLAVAGFVAATTKQGHADTVVFDDPLHGICAGCIDNGTNTPLVSQPFSFSVSSGPQTGTLLLEVLEPTAEQVAGVSPTGTVTQNGAQVGVNFTTSLLSREFNSGDLADFVGLPVGRAEHQPGQSHWWFCRRG